MHPIDPPSVFRADPFPACELDSLADITRIPIHAQLPVSQRAQQYAADIGDPYVFRVGDTAVRVCYAKGAPTLQERLYRLLT